MYLDTKVYVENLWKVWKFPRTKTHLIGLESFKHYYEEFSKTANITKIPDVIQNIFRVAVTSIFKDPVGFRNYKYIIDGDNYKRELE